MILRMCNEVLFTLASCKTYEEFMVNKDLFGWRKKKFSQYDSFNILTIMAAQHHDSRLACKLLRQKDVFSIGKLLERLMQAHINSHGFQAYIARNLCKMYDKIVELMYVMYDIG